MALIKCPECEKMISDSAETCPQCGYLIKQQQWTPNQQGKTDLRTRLKASGLVGGQITFMEKYCDDVETVTDLKAEYNKLNTIACICTLFGLLGGFLGWLINIGSKPKFAGYCMVAGLIGTVAAIIVVFAISAIMGGL